MRSLIPSGSPRRRRRSRRSVTASRALAVATSALLVLGSAGCGADTLAEKATEKAAEKAIEEAASSEGVDVDLDTEDGEISIETSDGSFTSGTGSLPDGFPDDVPVLDGEVLSGAASQQNGTTSYVVTIVVAATMEEAMTGAVAELERAGYTPTEGSMSMGEMLIEAYTGPWEVVVSATDDGSGDAMLQYVVTSTS